MDICSLLIDHHVMISNCKVLTLCSYSKKMTTKLVTDKVGQIDDWEHTLSIRKFTMNSVLIAFFHFTSISCYFLIFLFLPFPFYIIFFTPLHANFMLTTWTLVMHALQGQIGMKTVRSYGLGDVHPKLWHIIIRATMRNWNASPLSRLR